MARRLPSLPALRAFEAVARLKGVRNAAAELCVTPGAVSQQVKALEEELGVELVRRRGNALELTESALSGYEELTAGFRLLMNASSRMRAPVQNQHLKVSVDPAFAASWLIARLPLYRQRADSVEIMLDATSRLVDLTRNEADLAIRFGVGAFQGLVAHRLFEDEVFPVCSPRFLRGRHPLKSLEDLKRATLLHLDWSSRFGRWPDWDAWLQAAGVSDIDSRSGPHFSDHTLLLQAAIDGQGIALGTPALVKDHFAAKRLAAPFAKRLRTDFSYFVVYAQEKSADPAVRGFAEWLIAETQT